MGNCRKRVQRTEQQLCIYLLADARRKIRGRDPVHRDGHCTTQRTSPKRGNPFRAILSPKQNPLSLADTAIFQLARKLESYPRHIPVSPAHHPVSAPEGIRSFIFPAQKI